MELRHKASGESVENLVTQFVRKRLATTADSNSLYVSAPVNALIEGIYQENTNVVDFLRHGDFGLGTFNHLDGGMVVLGGEVCQLRSDGNKRVEEQFGRIDDEPSREQTAHR